MGTLRIGTSSFTATGWRGPFYPKRIATRDYLSFYATRFDTVEIESTFYGTPSSSTARDWYSKTPPGFIFAAKVPQVVAHEKVLVDCDVEFTEFVKVMDNPGEKLGPLLLQFPYFQKDVFARADEFIARLCPFLATLSKEHKFAVEVRNKHWLVPALLDALRAHRVALALIDHSYMPRPARWFEGIDPITADFTYVRWLGDRKEIEAITKVWNKTIVTAARNWQNGRTFWQTSKCRSTPMQTTTTRGMALILRDVQQPMARADAGVHKTDRTGCVSGAAL